MINSTTIKIPKKYEKYIQSIHHEEHEGYWVYLNNGYISTETECGTIHEYTQRDILRQLKTIIKGGLNYEN